MPSTQRGMILPDGRETQLTTYGPFDPETAGALRQAFSFIRANDDRRYSASVKMSLLTHADNMEAFDFEANEDSTVRFPLVLTVGTPYTYDEDTEVKMGGLLAVGVVLPDHRVLFCVNRNNRRTGIGRFLFGRLYRSQLDGNLSFWIHQENRDGQMFALSQGLMPWQVNRSGAVLYRANAQPEPEDDAVPFMDDEEIERRLRRTPRITSRHARRPGRVAAERADGRPSVFEARASWLNPEEEVRPTDDEILQRWIDDVQAEPVQPRWDDIPMNATQGPDGVVNHQTVEVREPDGTSWYISTMDHDDRSYFYQAGAPEYLLEGGIHDGYSLRDVQRDYPGYLQRLVAVPNQPAFFVRIIQTYLNRLEIF